MPATNSKRNKTGKEKLNEKSKLNLKYFSHQFLVLLLLTVNIRVSRDTL